MHSGFETAAASSFWWEAMATRLSITVMARKSVRKKRGNHLSNLGAGGGKDAKCPRLGSVKDRRNKGAKSGRHGAS